MNLKVKVEGQLIMRLLKLHDIPKLYILYKNLPEEDKIFFHPYLFQNKILDFSSYLEKIFLCLSSFYHIRHLLLRFYPTCVYLVMVILDKNSRVIGFSYLKIGAKISRDYLIANLGIVVHSSYRTYGLGKKLLRELIEYSKKYITSLKEIRLSVHKENRRAINLYRSLGFSVLEARRGREKWRNKMYDLIEMSLRLI